MTSLFVLIVSRGNFEWAGPGTRLNSFFLSFFLSCCRFQIIILSCYRFKIFFFLVIDSFSSFAVGSFFSIVICSISSSFLLQVQFLFSFYRFKCSFFSLVIVFFFYSCYRLFFLSCFRFDCYFFLIIGSIYFPLSL